MSIDTGFFRRDARDVAPDLIGCDLIHETGDRLRGRIVETEAYLGEDDPASHASGGQTSRNSTMYGPPGRSYVYICYGIHHMFNIVTGEDGDPQAVLVRAIEPLEGLDRMRQNRGLDDDRQLCDGPGKLCQAFEIENGHSDLEVTGGHLRVEDGDGGPIEQTTRIGVSGGEDLAYRFLENDNQHVSDH
jgi:DNA-3-methyladenine glycosylase